jgi:glycosyltransferase involved in cell wall biosynthesis
VSNEPLVSVVVRCRNEYPIILCTVNALLEDLEFSKIPGEIIVVSNCSTDDTVDVLRFKYQRWIKAGLLKIEEYNDKGSQACSLNRGLEVSRGKIFVAAEAHISLQPGTLGLLASGAETHGGIWHAPVQIWGDALNTKLYGFDLGMLPTHFWGGPCRHVPIGQDPNSPWKIAMAGACLYAVRRDEIEKRGLYHPAFKSYGGIEPYLDLKWWRTGSAVWMHPQALCRYSFGLHPYWKKATKDKVAAREIYKKDGKITKVLKAGDEYLAYGDGWRPESNESFFNFLLAARTIGGVEWLERVKKSREPKIGGPSVANPIAEDVLRIGAEDAAFIDNYGKPLNDLLNNPPWKSCGVHDKKVTA